MAAGRRKFFHLAVVTALCVGLWFGWQYGSDAVYSAESARWRASSIHGGSGAGSLWRTIEQHFPVTSFVPLPTGPPARLPPVQATFPIESSEARSRRLKRRQAVKDAFLRGWKTYKAKAWLRDEVTPVTGKAKDTFGGWGATLVDSLDTLWIMGLRDEFGEAVDAVARHISFETTAASQVNVFETAIRFLGGLLGAYDLSGDARLLDRAREVGDMLYKAFDTPSRMPIARWDVNAAARGERQADPGATLIAELGSLSLEFTRLSLVTGDAKYFDAVQRVSELLAETQMETKIPGLWPLLVDPTSSAKFDLGSDYGVGGMADSAYEYLIKMVALLGGQLPVYEQMYHRAVEAVQRYLLFRPLTPGGEDILVAGAASVTTPAGKPTVKLESSGQHLTCFLGGMLTLGGRLVTNASHTELGEKITNGCVWAYSAMPLGIMPETFHLAVCHSPSGDGCRWSDSAWRKAVSQRHASLEASPDEIIRDRRLPKGFTDIKDRRYILRPEAIESVFLLYRATADPILLERAWEMWESINAATQTDLANSGLWDVNPKAGEKPVMTDSMESFWFSETLKYFYLIFSESDLISLDEFVFNTEAHPFRRLVPTAH